MIEIFLAFIAGLLTIAAPCILLPLPILLGSSVGQRSKARPLFIALGFVSTFAVLGIALNFLVRSVGLDPEILRSIAVILLVLFALAMIWPTLYEKLTEHLNGLVNRAADTGRKAGTGTWGGFVMGVVIGIVWAPCAGPILGSILTLIAQETNITKAFGLLIAYATGAGIPMLIIAYGGQIATTRIKAIAKYAVGLQRIFGVVLLLLAGTIYFQYDTKIQSYILDKLPGANGQFESNFLCKFSFYVARGDECNQKELPGTTHSPQTSQPLTAPELTGITQWLNTDQPITLKELRGKVILIDFWTYSCINCIRTLPYVNKWYDTYKDKGFVVIGVHTPEFAFEKNADNVRRAIKQSGIHYPVALDNSYDTWNAYSNRYWPAEYLIDQNGNVVHTHFGEGKYNETEMIIKRLLGLTGGATVDSGQNLSGIRSPEMYFGTDRVEHLANGRPTGGTQEFVIPSRLDINKFALSGTWRLDGEKAVLEAKNGSIKLHFHSAKVHMVAHSQKPQSVVVRVDDYPPRVVNISGAELYTLFDSEEYGDHVLEITIPDAGFEAFTFTFG